MSESAGHGPIAPKPEGPKGLKGLFNRVFRRGRDNVVAETNPEQKPSHIPKDSGLAKLLEDIEKGGEFGKKDTPVAVSIKGENVAALFEQVYPDLLTLINSPDSSGQIDTKTREDFLNGNKSAVFRVVNNLQMELLRKVPRKGWLVTPEGRKALICKTINIAVSKLSREEAQKELREKLGTKKEELAPLSNKVQEDLKELGVE